MTPARRTLLGAGYAYLCGAFLTASLLAINVTYFPGVWLHLGSNEFPEPRHLAFLAFFGLYGSALAACFAVAGTLTHRFFKPGAIASSKPAPESTPDRRGDWLWMLGSACGVVVFSLALHHVVLRGGAVTDDESAYRFSAQLLASGRLSVESPQPKLFFDRGFMINDGHLYSQYFLGWPAILVPGIWLGAPELINPLLAGLGGVGLFLVVRRLAGSFWARASVVAYACSPMVTLGAGTLLSHTACGTLLVWLLVLALFSRDNPKFSWSGAAMAALFSVCFFVRPLTTAGLGLPVVAYFLLGLRRDPGRWSKLLGFIGVAAAFATLFLLVNFLLNGDPLKVSYERYTEYARENGYRFTSSRPDAAHPVGPMPFDGIETALARTMVTLFRTNIGLLGWPLLFLWLFLAGFGKKVRLLWAMSGSFVLLHFFMRGGGVDSFGPVHTSELVFPVLGLIAVGHERLRRGLEFLTRSGKAPGWAPPQLAVGLFAANVGCALAIYWPTRLHALSHIARGVNAPQEQLRTMGIQRALIFTPTRFVPYCATRPVRHFVLWRPNNHPDLTDDVLWVNDLGLSNNLRFSARFADRPAYVLRWDTDCLPRFLPLPPNDAVRTAHGSQPR